MDMIHNRNPITGEDGNCIAVARASVGIYLALCGENFSIGKKVIVPANLCYAGIYPAIYAGLLPVFCDVDPVTGNVTSHTFAEAYTNDVVAAIVPHMYGNPVEQLPEISSFCKENGILLIEDCASAMGATASHYKVGALGDYVVYSTGYSKTLDLGFGGFLFSKNRNLQIAEKMEQKLPDHNEEDDRNMAFFSKLYRLIRNEGTSTGIERMIYAGLPGCCRDAFLHRINMQQKLWLFQQLVNLPDTIQARKNALIFYEQELSVAENLRYPFQKGAVPWRYNLLIPGEKRTELIEKCLAESLPVSDWYPCVTKLFNVQLEFQGAQKHEAMILNFPLLIEEEQIRKICKIINDTI